MKKSTTTKAGRPAGNKRTAQIHVITTKAMLERIKEAAELCGQGISQFAMTCMLIQMKDLGLLSKASGKKSSSDDAYDD